MNGWSGHHARDQLACARGDVYVLPKEPISKSLTEWNFRMRPDMEVSLGVDPGDDQRGLVYPGHEQRAGTPAPEFDEKRSVGSPAAVATDPLCNEVDDSSFVRRPPVDSRQREKVRAARDGCEQRCHAEAQQRSRGRKRSAIRPGRTVLSRHGNLH